MVDPTGFREIVAANPLLFTGVYVILAMGSMLFLLGFLGCCGAIRENKCLLLFVRFTEIAISNFWTKTCKMLFFTEIECISDDNSYNNIKRCVFPASVFFVCVCAVLPAYPYHIPGRARCSHLGLYIPGAREYLLPPPFVVKLFISFALVTADRTLVSTAHPRLFHQGAESALSGQQQHGRLHHHLEHHHGYGAVNDPVRRRYLHSVMSCRGANALVFLCLAVQFECCGVNSVEDFDQQSLFRHLNPGRAVPEVCCLRNEQLINVDECLRGNMPFRIKVSVLRFVPNVK